MQEMMDQVPTEVEVQHLKHFIQDHVLTQSLQTNVEQLLKRQLSTLSFKSKITTTGTDDAESNVGTVYQNYASHAILTTNEKDLAKMIEYAKREEKFIKETLEKTTNLDEKREFLLQKFCVHTLTSFRRSIAAYAFKPHPKVAAKRYARTWFGFFSFIFVPCYFLFVALFVFLFGVQIGAQQTYAWLLSACISMLQELLLIRTVFVWSKTILLPSAVSKDVRTVYDTLMKRTNFIMLRKYGLMKDASSRIQHVSYEYLTIFIIYINNIIFLLFVS